MMTAAELHTLVNREYTMPDGSKRRALWERVPGLRPTTAQGSLILVVFGVEAGSHHHLSPEATADYFWALLPAGEKFALDDGIPPECASALIRVAIEDWLDGNMPEGSYTFSCDPKGGPHAAWVGECIGEDGNEDREWAYAPTLIESLAQAAHTLADALGVPH